MLTIYIDFKSPASYLALKPTLELIKETSVEEKWLPFSSRLFKIPTEQQDETVGERHRRVRAIAQRDTHLHYADALGLNMQFPNGPNGSDMALAALSFLASDPVSYIQAAFEAYWMDHADLNDVAVITNILDDCGHGEIDWSAATKKLQAIREEAEEQKIFETPSYLIDSQIFLGREHLPWIKRLLP